MHVTPSAPCRTRLVARIAACLLVAMAAALSVRASAAASMLLRASRTTILADGKSNTDIIAEVRDSSGRPLPPGSSVSFQTTLGTLSELRAQILGGIARVRLTSAAVVGIAHVTAFSADGAAATVDVYFTDDAQDTFQGNQYLSVTGPDYLVYSVPDRLIEANGKNGTARVTYRNAEIHADRVQVSCDEEVVRARDNVTLKRGRHVLHGTRLYYSLSTAEGYAIAELDGRLQVVVVSGDDLKIVASKTPVPNSYINFKPQQENLLVVARSLTYFPNDRLQFRRPKFYQNGVRILSLPYYELPLHSQELFSDQFISVGTSGFGLELPYYYNLTPTSTGIVVLRHQQQNGRSYYAQEPGWGIDVAQGYSSQGGNRYEGALALTGLTRGDWGFRWNHNQQINSATQGSLYLDLPQHQGLFSTTNLTQQAHAFRWGFSAAGGQTFNGPAVTSGQGTAFAETNPHGFGGSRDIFYTIGTTLNSTTTTSHVVAAPSEHQTSENLNMRFFTRSIALNRTTTLNNSFTVGHIWSDTGGTGLAALATVSLDHSVRGGGALNLTYDFMQEPSRLFDYTGKHRLSLTYTLAGSKRFSASIFGSAFLDNSDSSVLGDLTYRLSRDWRILSGATLQKFGGASYTDLQFTLGRRIGARELQFTYSTFLNRFSVDLTTTQF